MRSDSNVIFRLANIRFFRHRIETINQIFLSMSCNVRRLLFHHDSQLNRVCTTIVRID